MEKSIDDKKSKEILEMNTTKKIYSLEIEEYVLSSILTNMADILDLYEKVKREDFYLQEHRILFDCIEKAKVNSDIDEIVLSDIYSDKMNITPIDAYNKISKISNLTNDYSEKDSDEVRSRFINHFKILKTYSAYRYKLYMARDLLKSERADTPDEMINELSKISSKFNEIADEISVRENNTHHISKTIYKLMKKVDDAIDSDHATLGVTTGFDASDEINSGFQEGDFIVLAGRPSMGKTAICIQKMLNIAFTGVPVLFFSSEMPADQIILRMLSNLAKIDSIKISKGKMSDKEWSRLSDAIEKLEKLPITIDDTNGITISEIRQKSRKWHNENVLSRPRKDGIIFTDYLQIIKTNTVFKTQNEKVSHISQESKGLARELKVPYVMLSQLNRDLEKRPNKRPLNSDLRDSGAIEQDADIIMFIYRDEVYNGETAVKGAAELIYSKYRNGSLGVLHLNFKKEHQQFEANKFTTE